MYNNTKIEYNKLLAQTRAKKYESKIKNSDNKRREIINKDTLPKGEPSDVAEAFSDYFLDIVNNLTSGLNNSLFKCNIIENAESLQLTFVSEEEIIELAHRNLFSNKIADNTRNIHVIYPIHRLTLTEKGPEYMCLKLFDKLPQHLKSTSNFKLYKREIRKMLLNMEPYCAGCAAIYDLGLKVIYKSRLALVTEITPCSKYRRMALQGQDQSLFKSSKMPWSLYSQAERGGACLFSEHMGIPGLINWQVSCQGNSARNRNQSLGSLEEVSSMVPSVNGPTED
ncbi:hypothetical protein NQ315_000572 [Exocentrus adspersus]|uniref:Uncharacterized protein n=1 Tax=Exocentrus adspersus TaxID=1586481 RepID=A0AAV8VGM3_9CUCU|nr:hypothetical protein NQ315_000572 [Exocentrus adspersus]